MRISDWSSDVCSSSLAARITARQPARRRRGQCSEDLVERPARAPQQCELECGIVVVDVTHVGAEPDFAAQPLVVADFAQDGIPLGSRISSEQLEQWTPGPAAAAQPLQTQGPEPSPPLHP